MWNSGFLVCGGVSGTEWECGDNHRVFATFRFTGGQTPPVASRRGVHFAPLFEPKRSSLWRTMRPSIM